MSQPYSLRRRLVWLLTGSVAAIWLLSASVVYQRAHHEADELLDAQLTQVADTLLAIVAAGEVEHFVEELQDQSRHNPVPIAFEVWHGKHGQMQRLVTSTGHSGFESGVAPGFSEHLYQGARWRFYAVQDADEEYQVVVGQAHAAREGLAREIGLSLLFPAALALPLMALAVWWGVGRNLRLHLQGRQRGAQFVRGIRSEAAFVFKSFGDAPDQRVERRAQRRDFLRQDGRLVERHLGLRVQCPDLPRHRIHRSQVAADAPPDRQCHQR